MVPTPSHAVHAALKLKSINISADGKIIVPTKFLPDRAIPSENHFYCVTSHGLCDQLDMHVYPVTTLRSLIGIYGANGVFFLSGMSRYSPHICAYKIADLGTGTFGGARFNFQHRDSHLQLEFCLIIHVEHHDESQEWMSNCRSMDMRPFIHACLE